MREQLLEIQSEAAQPPLVYINQPQRGFGFPDLREVYQRRAVLYRLAMREIHSRYKQMVLGIAWSVITPLIQTFVFSFIFGNLAALSSEGIPYILFTYAAMVPWVLFSKGLGSTATSIVGNRGIIDQIYIPRLIFPLSKLFVGLIDFFIAFIILIIMMIIMGFVPRAAALIWIPYFTLITMVTGLGFGLWLCTLHVRFRDIGFAMVFLLQIWQFLTPVAYGMNVLEEPLRSLAGLNPMTAVTMGYRWALLRAETFDLTVVLLSTGVALLVLITGLLLFHRSERIFIDLL